MKWFKHDTDAHMDAKIRKLIHKWGPEGYGLYWYCLELIAKDVGAKNLTFEMEHDAEIIAHDLRMSRDKVEDMMRSMVELGLFENCEGRITCLKLFHRIDLSQGGSNAFREAISHKRQALKEQSCDSHDSVMTQSSAPISISISNSTKNKRFVAPTVDEVAAYCATRGNGVDPQKFHDHYTANGWMRGKNKIKDWKACVRTWEAREPAQSTGEAYH